jgi:hypothetical protein
MSTLKSSIDRLDGISLTFMGASAGVVMGTPVGKLKGSMGLYYSEPSVPYDIDMIQGSLTSNLYLLRLREVKYHTIEPYSIVGISRQRTRFYGSNLMGPENDRVRSNNSISDPPLAGIVGFTNLNLGSGLEYQLENRSEFIHFYAEFTYGIPLSQQANKPYFADTTISNPMAITVGINFGKIK